MEIKATWHNYGNGHPWYYFLGGPIVPLKELRTEAERSDRGGYLREEIEQLDGKSEPHRTVQLRQLKEGVATSLGRDLSRYREVVRELRQYRQLNAIPREFRGCDAVHTAMSLKVCHLWNGFANLHAINQCLNRQGDLFGF